MTEITVLLVWSLVGTLSASNHTSTSRFYEWRVLTTHPSAKACYQAAKTLNLPSNNSYRCLDVKTGLVGKE